MPVGVIVDALAVVIGGIVGAVAGKKLKKDFIDNMNLILGCCSMCMGVSTIVLMQHMPAVVFAIILGTGLGLAVHFGKLINKGGLALQKGISRFVKTSSDVPEAEFEATLVTCITLFCASGTGIYGSIIAGMSADHSVLIAKAILDLFTAVVFCLHTGHGNCSSSDSTVYHFLYPVFTRRPDLQRSGSWNQYLHHQRLQGVRRLYHAGDRL